MEIIEIIWNMLAWLLLSLIVLFFLYALICAFIDRLKKLPRTPENIEAEIRKELESKYHSKAIDLERKYREMHMDLIETKNRQLLYVGREYEKIQKEKQENAVLVQEASRLLKQFQSSESTAHATYDYAPSHFFDSIDTIKKFTKAYTPDFTIQYPLVPFKCTVISKSGETYETSLKTCTCKDYVLHNPNKDPNNVVPCKHIMALALHLGFVALGNQEKEKTLKQYNEWATELEKLDKEIKKSTNKQKRTAGTSSPRRKAADSEDAHHKDEE